jgi:hypothetical protein
VVTTFAGGDGWGARAVVRVGADAHPASATTATTTAVATAAAAAEDHR